MIFGAAPFGSCAYGTECGASTAPSTLVSYNGDGGVQSGGAATLIASWSYAASGGAQSSGVADVAAVVSPSHDASGGVQSGGAADVQYSAVVQASGGAQSGGTAVVSYQMAQDGDPYYDKVILLMHMDGANGSTSFVDETGKTITPAGDAQISTAQSVFGGASGVFDGTGDYLSVSDNSEFAFGTGDFTIEAKVRPTADGVGYLFGVGAPSPSQGFNFQFRNTANGNVVRFFDHSIPSGVNGTEIVASGVWNDVSLSRASGVLRAFVGGVKCLEVANNSDFTDTTYVMVGANPSPTPDGTSAAFIEELRVTKGVARYVSDYTVPSAAFPDFGQYEIDGTGGLQSGGSANIVASWVHVASGGGQSAGAADVEATLSGNAHVGEGGAQSGGSAAISFGIVLDASGGAQSGGSAALAVSSVVSGSGGGSAAGVGSVQTTWVLEGSGGGQSAGAADVEFFSGSTSYVYEGTGGGQSGGVAAVLVGWSVSGVGGAQSGGAAVIESVGTYAYDATGGAASGGSAAIQFGPAIVASGGAQAGGSADVDTNSAFVYEGSGGGVSGGAAALLLAVALVAVGGAVAGGSADVSSNTKSEVFGTGFSIVKREPDGFSTIIRPYPEGG